MENKVDVDDRDRSAKTKAAKPTEPEETDINDDDDKFSRIKSRNAAKRDHKQEEALSEAASEAEESDSEDGKEYCYCKKGSHGKMIACDSTHCTMEWFHYSCVGIKRKPRGAWYCNDCKPAEEMKTNDKLTVVTPKRGGLRSSQTPNRGRPKGSPVKKTPANKPAATPTRGGLRSRKYEYNDIVTGKKVRIMLERV